MPGCSEDLPGAHETNRHVAQVLMWMGQYVGLSEKGSKTLRFKQAAYRNAAESIAAMSGELTVEELFDMAGIGAKLRPKIEEILQIGTCAEFEDLKKEFGDLRELMSIKGVGPVMARKLHVTHGSQTVGDVRKLVNDGVVTNKAVVASLQTMMRRIPREEAEPVAEKIVDHLNKKLVGHNFKFCGSWRRQRADIKDFDVLTDAPRHIVAAAVRELGELAEDGETKISTVVDGIKLEMKLIAQEQWGSALLHLTGSWQFNARIRAVAKSKDMLLNEYGLHKGERLITSGSEKLIFEVLGMDFVEPKDRE